MSGGIMTQEEHMELYNEVSKVLYCRVGLNTMTPAQGFFVRAFEQAAFGADFVKVYSDLVTEFPDIQTRNLHAFCVGYGVGKTTGRLSLTDDNETNH